MNKLLLLIVIVLVAAGGLFAWQKLSAPKTPVSETSVPAVTEAQRLAINANAPIVVFKMEGDYRDLVSVVLSAGKTSVVEYPAPIDAALERPIALSDGYFIGQMPGAGNPNGAFLDLSIGEYSKMPESSIGPAYLYEHIAHRTPFTEIYNCSLATTRATMKDDINSWIAVGELQNKCGRIL